MDPLAFLARLRTRLRRVVVVSGTARLVASAVALVVTAVILDWSVHFPGWIRALALGGTVVALAALVWRRLLRPLRRALPVQDLAAFCERRIPALDGRLISAVEGIDLGDRDRRLLAAALPEGVTAGLIPARHLSRDLALAILAILVVGAGAVMAPGWSGDGLRRFFLPFGDSDWDRAGAMAITADRQVVAVDERVMLKVERQRGPAAPVILAWGDEIRQLKGLSGPWIQALAMPSGTHRLEVRSGDAQPVSVTVTVVDRPRLIAVSARITPPGYTGQPAVDAGTIAATVLPGTRIDTVLRFAPATGRTLAAVTVRLNGGELPLQLAGSAASTSVVVRKEGVLVVEAADADAIGLQPSPRFELRLAEDRAPLVAIDGFQRGEAVTPQAVVTARVRAQDDFGLGEVALVVGRIAGPGATASSSEPQRRILPAPGGLREAVRTSPIEIGSVAQPGDQVTVLGEALDRNDVTGPGHGKSEILTLRVVTSEELRQDLERQIAEAQDKVGRAREQVGLGLARVERLPAQARAAALDAARAVDLAKGILRRVETNRLPRPEDWAPVGEALKALTEAQQRLLPAAAGDAPAARDADLRLAAAERALAGLLQEGDLARTLAALIQRQQHLNEETVAAVRGVVLGQEGAQDRLAGAAERQKDLAEAVRDLERRLAGTTAPTLQAARAFGQQAAPAARLAQAARRLTGSERERAPEDQQAAAADLQKLLDMLRGAAAQQDLAARVGELAQRQERLAQAIEEGRDPAKAAAEQETLRQEVQALAQRLEGDQKSLADAAAGAQESAKEALGSGDRPSAGRQAGAAGSLLRRLQRELNPNGEPEEQKQGPKETNVLRLLKEIRDEQVMLLALAQPIHARLGAADPGFADGRAISDLADRQDGLRLRLTAEARTALTQNPIALAAVDRVALFMGYAQQHLVRPALGTRGMGLIAQVVAELERLIRVSEAIPPAERSSDQQGGGGQGGGQAPAFPPAAELSLLAEMSAIVADYAAAGRPIDYPAAMGQVKDLVELLERTTRPGSRPAVLLQRAGRAARSSLSRLTVGDRGATTLQEMQVLENSLRRILAEANGNGGRGGSSSGSDSSKSQGKPQKPRSTGEGGEKPQGEPGGSQGGGTPAGQAQSQSGATPGGSSEAAGQAQVDKADDGRLLNLPPEVREKLRQARDQQLTPAVLEVYQRYLEILLEEP